MTGMQTAAHSLGEVVKGAAEWTFWHTLRLILAVGAVLLLALIVYASIMKSCKCVQDDQEDIEKHLSTDQAGMSCLSQMMHKNKQIRFAGLDHL